MLTDSQIKDAIAGHEMVIEPFDEGSLQPASYDLRVGRWAFASSTKEKVDLSQRGVLIIEPGDFAVIETLERVRFGNQMAAQLGLRSEYARRGLLMLSGPQVDPGFEGVLVVRLMNLAPTKIAIPYREPFLTAQFFRLSEPVTRPFTGERQGQDGITATDIRELTETEGLTLGEVLKTLGNLAHDVSELTNSVSTLRGSVDRVGLYVMLGIGVIAVLVALIGFLK